MSKPNKEMIAVAEDLKHNSRMCLEYQLYSISNAIWVLVNKQEELNRLNEEKKIQCKV